MIFLAMAIGLATGMGYVWLAVCFFVIMALFCLVLSLVKFGGGRAAQRELRITIPENLDYDGLFDDLFEKHLRSCELENVRTTNMGTLYELSYRVTMKGERIPKEFLDEIRCRNGNLNVLCGRPVDRASGVL